MVDEIMTRNSAGELELRTVQTTGDTGNDKNDVMTRDSQGRLCVRTTGSGGGSGGPTTAEQVSMNPQENIGADNVQSAMEIISQNFGVLESQVSVLSTSVDLSTEIGGKTTVALADLSAMDIDGRPSYKQAGATVYSENGVVGIVDTVDSTNAVITTAQYSGGGGGDFLPLSGGTMTGLLTLTAKTTEYGFQHGDLLKIIKDSEDASTRTFIISANSSGLGFGGMVLQSAGGINPSDDSKDIGNKYGKWNIVFAKKINNGADIAIPTAGGTMVVATPPTDNGTYVLKATVVDGVITTEWVLES